MWYKLRKSNGVIAVNDLNPLAGPCTFHMLYVHIYYVIYVIVGALCLHIFKEIIL